MKSFFIILLSFVFAGYSFGQNKLLTYSTEIAGLPLDKNAINEKLVAWFERSFSNTYDKIKVNNRTAGVISGQAFFYSPYKVPVTVDDSANGYDFVNYYFDWVAKINNNKINFSITKVYINRVTPDITTTAITPVTLTDKSPFDILLQSEQKTDSDWRFSKAYLKQNLNSMINSLYASLINTNVVAPQYFVTF